MNPEKFSIECSNEMMQKIEGHCFSETQVEVGGFLVGYLDGDTAHVTNVFPAKHAIGAATQLTFNHDSWNAIYEQLEKEAEGSSLIGWFHSHPNFGVFLSDHDKFIQQNFFKQDGQITIVVDPIRGRRGWFFSDSGKIRTYREEVPTDRKRLGVSDSDADQNIEAMLSGSGKGVSVSKVIAISAVMSLISFVAGWTLTTNSSTDKASQTTVTQLLAEVDLIKRVLIENGIGVAQVPTKPSPEPVASAPTAAPKSPTAAPKSPTAAPKSPTAAPKSPTPKAPVVAKENKVCTPGQVDPKGELLCRKGKSGAKHFWVTPPPKILAPPNQAVNPETSTSGNK
jgi:proteasome lid subunit RPN8/RPN11